MARIINDVVTSSKSVSIDLYGRDRERERLRRWLDDATAGHGRFALVSGDVGIGKTSLVDDLAQEAARRGCLALTGVCYELTVTPPFGPWIDAFAEMTEPVAPICGEHALDTIANPEALYIQMLEYLRELSSRAPVVLILDDLHWADQASLHLLRYLARYLDSMRVLLLAVYREDELVRGTLLYSILPAYIREGRAERIQLRPLDADALRTWVQGSYQLSLPARDRLVTYLIIHAEGNPFFSTEILRTFEDQGILRRDGDRWELGDLSDAVVPVLLRQVIDSRLQRMSAEARWYLTLAAMIGHEAPLDLWGSIVGADEEQLFGVIEEAHRVGIVAPAPDGLSVFFRHALYREALYEAVLPPRRRIWHQRIADELITEHAPDPDVVAHHLQLAGDPRAIEWLERAGRRATQRWAWTEAAERFTRAIELLEGQPDTDERRAWYLLRLAELRRYNSPQAVESTLDTVREISAQLNSVPLRAMARWTRGRVKNSYGLNGLPDLEDASIEIKTLSSEEREIIRQQTDFDVNHCPALLTVWRAISGRYADALAAGDEYLSLPAEQRTLLMDAEVYLGRAIAFGALGKPAEARAEFRRTLDIYQRTEVWLSVGHTVYFYAIEALLRYEVENISERERIMALGQQSWRRAAEISITQEDVIGPALKVLDGRWEQVAEVVDNTRNVRSNYCRLWLAPYGAMMARYQGDHDRAAALIESVLPRELAYENGQVWITVILMLLEQQTHLALDRGQPERASKSIERYSQLLESSGRVSDLPTREFLLARYTMACGDVDQALQHARRTLELAKDPRQPLILLNAHQFLAETNIEVGEFELAASHFDQAIALATSCAAPFTLARIRTGQAGLMITTGKLDRASRLLDLAQQTAEPLSARPLLERIASFRKRLRDARSVHHFPAGLTAREVEVLRMVTDGMTDIQIGEALYISPRTVTTHVSNILNKIGANSRAAAAAYAVRQGLA